MAARRSQIRNRNAQEVEEQLAGEMYFEYGGGQWENTPRVNVILEGWSEKIYPDFKPC